jgi:hypothetical protein
MTPRRSSPKENISDRRGFDLYLLLQKYTLYSHSRVHERELAFLVKR